jgi:NAD(P)-dependent dehydrogenase (short-subunit alcohol dehydrogenase family)
MSKTWFITGATRGIGLEIARAALAAGHRVVATGRRLEALRHAFPDNDARLLLAALDVTDEAQALAAVEQAQAAFGRIDVLVNNAGYGQLDHFEQIGASDVRRQFDTNVFGVMNVTRAVLPLMRRQRAGHVFNLSSMAGVLGFAGASVYCATKFAVEGFSESLAPELQPFGIHVTLVEPGFFRTDFLDATSVRYGQHAVADYAEAAGAQKAFFEERNHRQAGDPAKLGAVVVQLAGQDLPPLRFAAGSDAVDGISATLAERQREVERWSALSVSTDAVAAA